MDLKASGESMHVISGYFLARQVEMSFQVLYSRIETRVPAVPISILTGKELSRVYDMDTFSLFTSSSTTFSLLVKKQPSPVKNLKVPWDDSFQTMKFAMDLSSPRSLPQIGHLNSTHMSISSVSFGLTLMPIRKILTEINRI